MELTIANWCIFFVGLVLPFLLTIFTKTQAGFDNHQPRVYAEGLDGARKRALWAIQNGAETFALFAVAVLLAERAEVAQATVDQLALGFVAARVAYSLCYIFNLATLRSLVWVAGTACIVALFVLAT